MSILDIVLLIIIAAVVILALRRMIRQRKKGGCSCGCGNCMGCTTACPSGKDRRETSHR